MNSNFFLSLSPSHLALVLHCPFVHEWASARALFFCRVQFAIYVIMCFIVYQKGAGITLSKYTHCKLKTWISLLRSPLVHSYVRSFVCFIIIFFSFEFSSFFKCNQFEISTHTQCMIFVKSGKFILLFSFFSSQEIYRISLRCREITIISHEYAVLCCLRVCVCDSICNAAIQWLTKGSHSLSKHFNDHDLYFHPVWNDSVLTPIPRLSSTHNWIVRLFLHSQIYRQRGWWLSVLNNNLLFHVAISNYV